MNPIFAERTKNVHRSFIREILKVTGDPEIISFAGGLPNPESFPVREIAAAAAKVLAESGTDALQYSTTEGHLPLRQWIADRYRQRFGMKVNPNEILITNGSQQGLDLIAKVFLNEGDKVLLESPSYLGMIQAFSMFQPEYVTVQLEEDGPDLAQMKQLLNQHSIKLFYAIPNFQNPSGVSYSLAKRKGLADLINQNQLIMVEDDPYGELRFLGEDLPPVHQFINKNAILLGTFSKVVSPGMRMGWIYAPEEIMEKLITLKQGTDLHSNYFTQCILHQFLIDNDLEPHIAKIKDLYGRQRKKMVEMIQQYFPEEVQFTKPEGGMFLWVTLPEGFSALELFETAIREKVAFVPGDAFYVSRKGVNTMRLNFSNSDETKIEVGIKRLGMAIKKKLTEK